MTDLLGRVTLILGDRYSVERELGRGGMAVVYLARDIKHERRVALKVLHPELTQSLAAERFLREIKLSASLTHPHILALYDSGRSEGLLYYVMPYIEGESLRDRLTRERRLGLDEALKIGREVADGLDYAHARGVVHRDIKPENILLGGGHAIVADFGIARAMTAAGANEVTGVGAIVGTPMYMSPEQVAGNADLDGRSDIYSLGCVLFEALAGVPPFSGPTVQEILLHRLTQTAPRLRTIDAALPASVEAVLAKVLEIKPADRYATAGELSSALHAAESGKHSVAPAGRPYDSGGQRAVDASIAVLPFANLSSDPETEYFSDGMTEEIINALTQVPGLRVAARTSSFAFKGRNADAREIGERLRVRTLLEGSVRKAGDRVRITAQLINATDGYHLWSQTYERTLADVFAVQDELSRAIARTLTRTVAGTTSEPLVEPPTQNLDAYALYLKGRHAFALASVEGFQTAVGFFEQAVALDPDYAVALAWLGYGYAMLGFDEFGMVPPREAMPKAKAAVARAIDLDDGLGDAHFVRAVIAFVYDWDWPLAQAEFERMMSLPSTAALAQHWYAMFLCAMGQGDQALQVIRRTQLLEPLSLTVQVTACRVLHYTRQFDEGVKRLRAHLEANPGSMQGSVALTRTLMAQARYAEALAEIERGLSFNRHPVLIAYGGQAHGELGHRDEALAFLAELRQVAARRYIPVLYEALIMAGLHDLDEMFRLYEVAYEQRGGWLSFIRGEPGYDPLREDPRFIDLIKRMRLDF